MNTRFNIALRFATICLGVAIWTTTSRAADYYFGTFDDMPTYNLINSYSDPNRTGWYDFAGLVPSANTSTTIGVTTGTQSLAWQPGGVGYYQGLTYKIQIAPKPLADRNAFIEAMLANTHLAMNVTWDRNEWVTQHNGDISSSNYSLVNFVINYGPNGAFSSQGAPDIDTGNSNFKGGWDPVNYTSPTHTRTVMWDYSELKPALQAMYDAHTMDGAAGWLELILVTNAGNYNYPITYYLDSMRFTTPVVGVPGDYNGNGTVDAADYVLWRKGGPLQNEVDTPGTVNAADYTAWRARFGNITGSGSGLEGTAVPEASTLALLFTAAGFIGVRRRDCR
jgi:hypothetical protein